jgi:hypothetical protein
MLNSKKAPTQTSTNRYLCAQLFSGLSLHIHEQPLLASQLRALTELVQCSKPKANPAKVLCQGVAGELVGTAVDAEDEAAAGEVSLFAEFEEGHKTIYC